MNLEAAKEHFQKYGYVIIKNQFQFLEEGKKDILDLLDEAKKGNLKTADVFNDYPNLTGEHNIGIIKQFLWEDMELNGLKKVLSSIDWKTIYKEVLDADYDNYETLVHRIHTTNPKYKYSSIWHRDEGMEQLTIREKQTPHSLRINLYFFEESGFKIIPKDRDLFYASNEQDHEIWTTGDNPTSCQTSIDGEITVKAEPGDMLIFHPELWHRPYCNGFRAHVHMISMNRNDVTNPNNGYINHNEEKFYVDLKRPSAKRQWLNFVKYYAPLPSRSFFKYLIKKPPYLKNKFIQRPSIYQR